LFEVVEFLLEVFDVAFFALAEGPLAGGVAGGGLDE